MTAMGEVLTLPLELPKAHRSNSQLNTWLKCGEAHRLEKVEKAPAYPAAWLHSGSTYHAAVERYEKSERSLDPLALGRWALDDFDRRIAEEKERWPDLSVWGVAGKYKPQDYIDSLRAKVVDWVLDYIQKCDAWTIWTMPSGDLAIEVPFMLDFGTVLIRGFIDQILVLPSGELMVRDLKSGSTLPSNDYQLGLYKVVIERQWGDSPQWGDFYMGGKLGKATLPTDLSVFTENRIRQIYTQLDLAIRLGIHIPNPSKDNCRSCGVKRFCPLGGGTDMTYQLVKD